MGYRKTDEATRLQGADRAQGPRLSMRKEKLQTGSGNAGCGGDSSGTANGDGISALAGAEDALRRRTGAVRRSSV